VTSGCCYLERLSLLALVVDVNQLSRLDAEGWAVNSLAINKDVAVNNHLTSLRHSASEA
jgi:hypothetical protein